MEHSDLDREELEREDQAEVDALAARARKIDRRTALKAAGSLAFVVPAMATSLVPRTALG